MTTRRSFLAAALAACAAPAYVKAGILMPVKKVWAPTLLGMDFGTDGGTVIFRADKFWIAGAHGGDVFFVSPQQDLYRQLRDEALSELPRVPQYRGEVGWIGTRFIKDAG